MKGELVGGVLEKNRTVIYRRNDSYIEGPMGCRSKSLWGLSFEWKL